MRKLLVVMMSLVTAARVSAQETDTVTRVDLSIGRSHPVTTPSPILRISVAAPDIADVIVVGEREIVMNGKAPGETDAIVWTQNGTRQHFRVSVHSPGDRMQVVLYMRFAEVRRDFLQQLGTSVLYRDNNTRVGTGQFRGDPNGTATTPNGASNIPLPSTGSFLTVLSNLGTDRLLALLEAEETRGGARTLAEPNVMAGNKEWGTFHAGGELPIPIAQGTLAGTAGTAVTIVWRPFGVQMRFMGEIVSDSLIRLSDTLEVSDLDYTNAITLSGFSIPALRTRRVESTLDVRRNQSLIISGLFNSSDQRTKTGVPYLMNIPLLGALFSSQSFQRNETELIVVVTPVVVDPMRVRVVDVATPPDTVLNGARDALKRPAGITAGAPMPPSTPPKKPQ